jgi:putative hydrolase of the HAD superfamily
MTPQPPTIRGVVLDYGLVLCRQPTAGHLDRIASIFGVDHSTFWQLYERNRLELDEGTVSPEDYWQRFSKSTGTQLTDATLSDLQDWDIQMWSDVEPSLIEWLSALRAAKYKTAILSNLHARFVEHLRQHSAWLNLFDRQFFSSELRLIKPDPAIFCRCVAEMELEPQELLFIDDRATNVEAARMAKMSAIQYRSVAELRADLELRSFAPLPGHD